MSTIRVKTILRYLPIFLYHAVFAVIVFANFPLGKFFIGWDALNPELNLPPNFQRSFFASWQENYGLGTLAGHGFAAQLPHNIIISILSLLFPMWAVRSVFTFLCLYLGGLGLYFLARLIFYKITVEEYQKKFSTAIEYICLLIALFYILNLATVQMFYLQLEAFIVHFATLPWLFWIIFRLAGETNRKNLVLFFIINFFASIQGFIPSIFVAYAISLSLFAFVYMLVNRLRWATVKKSLLVLSLTFLVNAYWLLPFGYYQITRGELTQNAYNNLITTEDFVLKNKKYGDIANVALMKGFSFDMQELGGYVFQPWIEHYNQNGIQIIGYGLFVFVLVSALLSLILIRHVLVKISAVIFLYFLASLATDSPVFSQFTQIMQTISPSYYEAFRTAFTKFALGYSFLFSLFLGLGLYILLGYSYRLLKRRVISLVVFIGLSLLVIYYTFPIFKGNLLYKKLQVNIPQAYFEVMDFFKDKEGGRIADFPQDCPEGWYGYKWGYFGSGFYWYGIKQPILARTFDVWSPNNENYYWEVVQAVRSQDFGKVDLIMQKYGVKWVLYDPNLIHCRTAKGFLGYDEFIKYLENSSKYRLVKSFASGGVLPIKIYENLGFPPKDFIFLAKDLPMVGPKYNWTNYDRAYEEYGNYMTQNQKCNLKIKTGGKDLFFGAGGLFVEGDIHKEDSNRYEERDNEKAYIDVEEEIFSHRFSDSLSILMASSKKNIAPIISLVNQIIEKISSGTKLGERIINPIYPADRLVNKPERTRTPDFVNTSLIRPIYAKDNTDEEEFSTAYVYYPFRSLFTGRKQEELEFQVEDNGEYFTFTSGIPKELEGGKLIIPPISEEEVAEIDENDLSKITTKYPQIFLEGEFIPIHLGGVMASTSFQPATPEVEKPREVPTPLSYIKEGNLEVRIPKIKGYYSYNLQPTTHNLQLKSCDQFNKGVYKHERVKRVRPSSSLRSDPDLDLLRLISIGSSNCLDFDLPRLAQRLSYLVTVESRNIEGKSLLFAVINKNSQRTDVETYLQKHSPGRSRFATPSRWPNGLLEGEIDTTYFIQPPMEQYGLGYNLHFDNVSIGRVQTVNDLGRITVNPIPYRFLTSLKIIKGDPLRTQGVPLQSSNLTYRVDHPNPSFYQITIRLSDLSTPGESPIKSGPPSGVSLGRTNNLYLVLSQSFDKGWRAYEITNNWLVDSWYMKLLIPLFAKKIDNHVLVNNWENGWEINIKDQKSNIKNSEMTVIILYLPQYLEYFGFLLLGGCLVVFMIKPNFFPPKQQFKA